MASTHYWKCLDAEENAGSIIEAFEIFPTRRFEYHAAV